MFCCACEDSVAYPLHAEPPLSRIEKGEAQYGHILSVALVFGLQLRSETLLSHSQLTLERVEIGTELLVDFDPVALDRDSVLERMLSINHGFRSQS